MFANQARIVSQLHFRIHISYSLFRECLKKNLDAFLNKWFFEERYISRKMEYLFRRGEFFYYKCFVILVKSLFQLAQVLLPPRNLEIVRGNSEEGEEEEEEGPSYPVFN